MDQLAPLGTQISSVIFPTIKIYAKVLQGNAAAIKSTKREEFAYGSHARQKLDLYSAHTDKITSTPSPVIAFFPGGGFVRGGKRFPLIPDDLQYANVGHFFASRGYETVIGDYRLAGRVADNSHEAVYPQGAEDVAGVVEWIVKHLGGMKGRKLFLFGASAGGSHLATFLLHPSFAQTRSSISSPSSALRLAGVCLASSGLAFVPARLDPDQKPGLALYMGEDETQWEVRAPLGLLKQGQFSKADLPPTLLVAAELDPPAVFESQKEFVAAWPESEIGKLHQMKAMGQNHISEMCCLGTGSEKEEEWGRGLLAWMESQL